MSFLTNFALLADDTSWGDFEWLKDVVGSINWVMVPLMILVGTAGLIYAVVLGVNLARADGAEKIKEAKQRLINAIVGLVSIILLCLLLWLFIDKGIPAIFGSHDGTAPTNTGSVITLAMGLFS